LSLFIPGRIQAFMQTGRFEFVMIAILKADVLIDHAALLRGCQDYIRFDHASRIDDHPGAKPAIMADGAANYRTIGKTQVSITIQGTDGGWHKIIVCKGRARSDEGVASNDTHLKTSVLRHHAVLHHGRHEQRSPKWKECSIAHDRQHQLNILRDVHVTTNDAVLDHRASINGDVISNRGRPMNNCVWIDRTIFTDLHEFGTFQNLTPFVDSLHQDPQFETQILIEPFFKTCTAREQSKHHIRDEYV